MVGRRRPWAAKLDMYRKVPGDLLQGSQQGSFVSWIAIVTILVLFLKETIDFRTTRLTTDLVLDHRQRQRQRRQRPLGQQEDPSLAMEEMMRVTLNITMMDLKCDFIEIDAVSVLGNNQNVTKLVNKFPIDAHGVMNLYAHRNVRQQDVPDVALHDKLVFQSIEQLHESGQDAVSLDETTLQYALNENTLLFVDFFASWCSHCQLLAPTWEVFAKVMNDATNDVLEEAREDYSEEDLREAEALKVPVLIAKVDCVEHHGLCMENQISAYPTLRLFVEGKPFEYGDYRGHRTIMDLILFLKEAETILGREGVLSKEHINAAMSKHLSVTTEEKHWAEALERTRHHHHQGEWNPDLHPGCQLHGSILLNRVPGKFYIQAYSPHHELAPHMTNVSHEIHHLSFTPLMQSPKDHDATANVVPPNFESTTHPLDGNVYVTHELHQAYHHYVKLVTTNDQFYQLIQNSQLAQYEPNEVPEAKFIIDLSPIAVRYRKSSRHWYDYITSLFAIVGGTFTVVGFLEAGARHVASITQSKRMHPYQATSNGKH